MISHDDSVPRKALVNGGGTPQNTLLHLHRTSLGHSQRDSINALNGGGGEHPRTRRYLYHTPSHSFVPFRVAVLVSIQTQLRHVDLRLLTKPPAQNPRSFFASEAQAAILHHERAWEAEGVATARYLARVSLACRIKPVLQRRQLGARHRMRSCASQRLVAAARAGLAPAAAERKERPAGSRSGSGPNPRKQASASQRANQKISYGTPHDYGTSQTRHRPKQSACSPSVPHTRSQLPSQQLVPGRRDRRSPETAGMTESNGQNASVPQHSIRAMPLDGPATLGARPTAPCAAGALLSHTSAVVISLVRGCPFPTNVTDHEQSGKATGCPARQRRSAQAEKRPPRN
jgi:hypothetical protein